MNNIHAETNPIRIFLLQKQQDIRRNHYRAIVVPMLLCPRKAL